MLKHRKPQKPILSGEFVDPYGRAESRRSGAWVSCFSEVLETFQAQMQILKSKPVE